MPSLKPGARPIDSADDPSVATSPADCRMTAFNSFSEAHQVPPLSVPAAQTWLS